MAEDLHENRSNAGVRILGGDFEVKKLKREIRIFGQNALTELRIRFEQIATENGAQEGPQVADQEQKFVFPFSDDKNLTYFQAKYIRPNGEDIQTLNTVLKEKKQAKEEYQRAVASQKVGAMVSTKFRCDEYTIEMGNKPEGTKYIDVDLKYFETLKTEYRYEERLFTLTVPRHKKRRYNPLFADNMDVDDEINDSSFWIDEIEIIEPRPCNTTVNPSYQILRVEWDDKRWEIDAKDGNEVPEGKKWSFYEIDQGDSSGSRFDRNGRIQPDRSPQVGQAKNDLEVRFFMKTNIPPAINIEYMDASESEAVVSIEFSEENLREQITNMPAQDLHGDNDMEYDINNTPGSSVVSAQPMEYIFLIDCSGSMSGTFMENTRRTMSLIMNSIEVGSKVIFCRFGSRYIFQPAQRRQVAEDDEDDHHYYPYNRQRRVYEMREANWIIIDDEDDEQEALIKDIIDRTQANLGGTVIREPLEDILALRQDDGVYRNIIVLTDGAVRNTEEVHRVVKEATVRREGYLRFFALGIGSGASRTLCDGIAKFGRGSSVYVLDDDRIQAKASLILKNASRPSIYLQKISLPSNLEKLGYSIPDELDMSIFGFKRIYMLLKSKNQTSIWRNLEEGVSNRSFYLNINREQIPMMKLEHNMQPWYNNAVKLRAFWAKQEINYLDDTQMPAEIMSVEAKYAYQVEASNRGGTLCDHTAFVGVMDRVGSASQERPLRIQHEGTNTSSGQSHISRHSGYMAAGGSSFGPPPPSGGGGSASRAMFSGVIPPCGGMQMTGRPPMAAGIGGRTRRSAPKSKAMNMGEETIITKPRSRVRSTNLSNKTNESEKLSTFDRLMSLVKRNGLWPASEGKAILGCLMKYNKNFDKIFEDYRSKIGAVDLILTLLVLVALEKYEERNQIEWAQISIKAKKKLLANNINADAEIKDVSMIL